MGIGPSYRQRNPYTHSDASYDAMQSSLKSEINELKKKINQNPDPYNYEVVDVYQSGDYLCLKVKYPNCTNAEGVKIMVIKESLLGLIKRKSLDPHFGANDAPIARFEPTAIGWEMGINFINLVLRKT